MQSYHAQIRPLSAFATPLKGDTLFGQVCWAIRNRFGENSLGELLQGYAENKPFLVVSDAFPKGYLPLPKLPSTHYDLLEDADRKAIKKLQWLPEEKIETPVRSWLHYAVNNKIIATAVTEGTAPVPRTSSYTLSEMHPQPHNTINRYTNTTGEGGFAPYSVKQEWFVPGLCWSLYLALDSARLNAEDCEQCLKDVGLFGYGKDASIGLGKFEVMGFQPYPLPRQANANACLTLAPCAPQGLGFDGECSYYQPLYWFR